MEVERRIRLTEMSSLERFMRALHLEEPDTVPVTFSYVDPFAELNERKKQLGYGRFHDLVRNDTDIILPKGPKAPGIFYSSTDQAKSETKTQERGRHYYHCDTLSTPLGTLQARRKSEKDISTSWTYEGYIKSEEDVEKILSIPYDPLEVDASPLKDAQSMLKGRGIVATGIVDPVCSCAGLFTLRDFALTASQQGRVMRKLLRFFATRTEEYTRQLSEQTTEVFYRIVGPEYVTPPILPPKLFHEYVVPYDRRIVRIIKDTDNIAAIHCHGRIGAVLDGMRMIDPQALEPIEPPPQGNVTLAELKERMGDKTCLMGYIQYNDLEFDRPENIRAKVCSAISQAGAGGGYVLFPTAEPIARISGRLLANQRMFVSAGREFGRYV